MKQQFVDDIIVACSGGLFPFVQFVSLLFDGLSSSFEWGPEASLFLNVLNGALLLHSDDNALLRHTCATYVNASRKFVNLFPLHG